MDGLTVAEMNGVSDRTPFIDVIANKDPSGLQLPELDQTRRLRDYVEYALRSGFPTAALRLPRRID